MHDHACIEDDADAALRRHLFQALRGRLHERIECDRFHGVALLADVQARKHQEFFHQGRQALHFIEAGRQRIDIFSCLARAAQGDFDFCAQARQGRAQFMRGVGREAPLRIVAVFQALQHGVQGIDQAADLVLRAGMGQALVQAGFADRMRLPHHVVDGAQHATREHFASQPDGGQQGQRHGAKQYGGCGQHVVDVIERTGHLHDQARAGRGYGDGNHAQRLLAELGQGFEDGLASGQARQQDGLRRQLRRLQVAAARQHAAFAVDDLHQAIKPHQ